jgi:hypothetical protein
MHSNAVTSMAKKLPCYTAKVNMVKKIDFYHHSFVNMKTGPLPLM